MNRWWAEMGAERYWLEITRRKDLGVNLNAPTRNEADQPYWGYSLIREIAHGDIVFHYHQDRHAILAVSRAVGEVWNDTTVWAARGTSARESKVEPHPRPGWYLGVESFTWLDPPLSLDSIRREEQTVRDVREELESRHGTPVYFPLAVSDKRAIRPSQAYLTKLPRALVEHFPALRDSVAQLEVGSSPPSSSLPGTPPLGIEYRRADESATLSGVDPFAIDPAIRERGVRGHAATQNALADLLEGEGHQPRSPRGDEPDFDLAWEVDGAAWVAEVKSLTPNNEERQLRLGLGQLIRYRHLLERTPGSVRAVLAVEREPRDPTWLTVCNSVGVELIWPASFSRVLGSK